MGWWGLTFRTGVFAIAATTLGKELPSKSLEVGQSIDRTKKLPSFKSGIEISTVEPSDRHSNWKTHKRQAQCIVNVLSQYLTRSSRTLVEASTKLDVEAVEDSPRCLDSLQSNVKCPLI